MSAYICNTEHFVALGVYAADLRRRTGANYPRVDPRYIDGMEAHITTLQDIKRADNGTLWTEDLAAVYADVLYQENIRSVLARYPQDDLQSAPGLCEKPDHIIVTHQQTSDHRYHVKPIDILCMCNCLEYQSCETEDYRDSLAWRLMENIRAAAVHELPGYDKAIRDFQLPDRKAA